MTKQNKHDRLLGFAVGALVWAGMLLGGYAVLKVAFLAFGG